MQLLGIPVTPSCRSSSDTKKSATSILRSIMSPLSKISIATPLSKKSNKLTRTNTKSDSDSNDNVNEVVLPTTNSPGTPLPLPMMVAEDEEKIHHGFDGKNDGEMPGMLESVKSNLYSNWKRCAK
eukprot:UN00445